MSEMLSRYITNLYRKYDYMVLAGFVCNLILYMMLLYLQRDGQRAYSAYHALDSSLSPEQVTMTGTEEVYDWIEKVVTDHWTDPMCGDQTCDEPFEFPSYGRFGCRVDCGYLSDRVQTSSLNLEIGYDFRHPTGSIPPTELAGQARWNLCPATVDRTAGEFRKILHGEDCYFEKFQTFDNLAGVKSVTVEGVPDGEWELRVVDDIFGKVNGTVTDRTTFLATVAERKRQIAAVYGQAARHAELDAAQALSAVLVGRTPEEELAAYGAGLVAVATAKKNELSAAGNTNGAAAAEAEATAAAAAAAFNQTLLEWGKTSIICQLESSDGAVSGVNTAVDCTCGNATQGGTGMSCECANSGIMACRIAARMATSVRAHSLAIRLGEVAASDEIGETAGKYAATAALEHLSGLHPGLVAEMTTATGLNASDVHKASMKTLYIESVTRERLGSASRGGLITAARGAATMGSGNAAALDAAVAASAMTTSLAARVAQLSRVIGATASSSTPVTPTTPAVTVTVSTSSAGLFRRSVAADDEALAVLVPDGAASTPTKNQTSPLFSASATAGRGLLVKWSGGRGAYLTCNLDQRAAQYKGQCLATSAVPGGRATAAVCAAVCNCKSSCGANNTCTCETCVSSVTAAPTPTNTSSLTATNGRHRHMNLRRHLLNATVDGNATTQLTVAALQAKQETLSAKLATLTAQHAQTAAAQTRGAAETDALKGIIERGFTDVKGNQERMLANLAELLRTQNEALERAKEQARSQQTLAAAVQAQSAAFDLVAVKALAQMDQIEAARVAGLLDDATRTKLLQDLAVQQARAQKSAFLSNQVCQLGSVRHKFSINRGYNYSVPPDAVRDRNVGLKNHLLGGLLLTAKRQKLEPCKGGGRERFSALHSECPAGMDNRPYGVDPVFKLGSSLYVPPYDTEDNLARFYNCSEVPNATYSTAVGAVMGSGIPNAPPFCAELFSPMGNPYGFHSVNIAGKDEFPVYFDVNLDERQAKRLIKYLREGLYLTGQDTKELSARMVVYNAELNYFGSIAVRFDFNPGGSVKVARTIHTVRVELYSPDDGWHMVRMVMEFIFVMMVCLQAGSEAQELYHSKVHKGSYRYYFISMWNYLDIISIGLLVYNVVSWIIFTQVLCANFDPKPRFDVYANLAAMENPLRFDQSSAGGLSKVLKMLDDMSALAEFLQVYMNVCGITLLIMVFRAIKLMDFQPRLGVITRALWMAGSDLLHFFGIFALVFFVFVIMGNVLFGQSLSSFATFEAALNTLFADLLGDVRFLDQLQTLTGWSYYGAMAFFWSYNVVVYFVLINFLLAIICDAFGVVKANASESTGMFTELIPMMQESWKTQMRKFGLYQNHVPEAEVRQTLHRMLGNADWKQGDDMRARQEQKMAKPKRVVHVSGEGGGGEDLGEEEIRSLVKQMYAAVPLESKSKKSSKARGGGGGGGKSFAFASAFPSEPDSSDDEDFNYDGGKAGGADNGSDDDSDYSDGGGGEEKKKKKKKKKKGVALSSFFGTLSKKVKRSRRKPKWKQRAEEIQRVTDSLLDAIGETVQEEELQDEDGGGGGGGVNGVHTFGADGGHGGDAAGLGGGEVDGGDLGESMMAVVGLLTELVSTRDEINKRQGELESSLANLASSFRRPEAPSASEGGGPVTEMSAGGGVIEDVLEDELLEEDQI